MEGRNEKATTILIIFFPCMTPLGLERVNSKLNFLKKIMNSKIHHSKTKTVKFANTLIGFEHR